MCEPVKTSTDYVQTIIINLFIFHPSAKEDFKQFKRCNKPNWPIFLRGTIHCNTRLSDVK